VAPHFQRVPLVFKETLFDAGARIEFFYFPLNGVISQSDRPSGAARP
jgi:hypothetical protein